MKDNVYVGILAGGIGTRFWPLSRMSRPKQFIDILGFGKTLIQLTYERYTKICKPENIIVVTSAQYVKLVKEQLPELREDQLFVEPYRKNTAPSIAYAANKLHKKDPNAVMIVAPSDHLIQNEDKFTQDINLAVEYAEKNPWLITLGIVPTRPDTGYGYIQFTQHDNLNLPSNIKKVKTFTEKPNLDLAKEFIKSGEFLWNAGIFVWSTSTILEALKTHAPDIASIFEKGKETYYTPGEKDFLEEAYLNVRNISIDYAVMEKTKENVYVVLSQFLWSDLGTWGSLHEHMPQDNNKNALHGNVMLYNTQHCLIHIKGNKLALIQGLKDYIVVDTEDVLMIVKKEDEQNIRHYVNDVLLEKGEEYT
jgi:mannose-1-phosphate guanylyltransferase